MYSLPIAYILWLISGFGAMGFHRMYLGKFVSGILYFFTGGLFMVGGIVDVFRMPRLVEEANMRKMYRDALMYGGMPPQMPLGPGQMQPQATVQKPKESLEITILRTAKKLRGIVTPGEVALEGNLPLDEARQALDKLVSSGYAQMQVTDSGLIQYRFAEFADDRYGRRVEL